MEQMLPKKKDANTRVAIESNSVRLSFLAGKTRQVVLDQLDLQVCSGQIVSLLGPSGCGKSSLLRVIAGLQEPDQGHVAIDDVDVSQQTSATLREKVSFVFQEATLLPWRTVWQNVILPLEIRGLHRENESRDYLRHLLGVVGFKPNDWNKYPSQLSGGMKMRASIARAMSTRPSILLLDEPFAALDDLLRSKLNDLLLKIVDESHCTMLFVTHNIAEAIYLSHSIAVMSRGRIAERLEVPFAFPRQSGLRSTQEFAQYYGVVANALTRNNE